MFFVTFFYFFLQLGGHRSVIDHIKKNKSHGTPKQETKDFNKNKEVIG